MVELDRILQEKDEETHSLQDSVRKLERANQQLKEEQESLKTVNQLSLEDMNKLNSDLQLEVCRSHSEIVMLVCETLLVSKQAALSFTQQVCFWELYIYT